MCYLVITLRRFKVRGQPDALALGRITRWLREDAAAGDGALFHCVHDDGDQEDLEEEEVSSLVIPLDEEDLEEEEARPALVP